MIPDGDAIGLRYLRDHPDVAALDTRVLGQTPRSTDASWIRVTQLDASDDPTSGAEHLISYLMQFDCYAGKAGIEGSQRREASLLARTVRAALHEMPDETFDDVVVTAVRFVGMPRIPDTEVDEPARERYVLTAVLFMHSRGS